MTAKDGNPCKKCGSSEWYKSGNCKMCNKEQGRKWRATNPERVIDNHRRWYADNSAKQSDSNAKWRAKNHDKVRASCNRYHARKVAAGGKHTAREWKALLARYGNRCLCCGRADVKLVTDHIVPVALGGTSNIHNIQPLCRSCNSRKGKQIIDYRPR